MTARSLAALERWEPLAMEMSSARRFAAGMKQATARDRIIADADLGDHILAIHAALRAAQAMREFLQMGTDPRSPQVLALTAFDAALAKLEELCR